MNRRDFFVGASAVAVAGAVPVAASVSPIPPMGRFSLIGRIGDMTGYIDRQDGSMVFVTKSSKALVICGTSGMTFQGGEHEIVGPYRELLG